MNVKGVIFENLKARRLAVKLSMKELAGVARVSVSLVAKAERGETISRLNVVRLTDAIFHTELKMLLEIIDRLEDELQKNEREGAALKFNIVRARADLTEKRHEIDRFRKEN